MEQLTFNFENLIEDKDKAYLTTSDKNINLNPDNINSLIFQFRERIKSTLTQNNFDCYVEYSNYRLLLRFCFNLNGKRRNISYFASPDILNSSDYEFSLILSYVAKERVECYKELRKVLRKFAFYPKCRSHNKNTYTTGKVYNLTEIFCYLNSSFFSDKLVNPIFWRKPTIYKGYNGKNPKFLMRKIKSIRLGSYCVRCNTIFINSILDNEEIPQWVVEAIVSHEMAHSYVYNFISHFASPHGSEFKAIYNGFPYAKEVKKMISSPHFFNRLKEIYVEKVF